MDVEGQLIRPKCNSSFSTQSMPVQTVRGNDIILKADPRSFEGGGESNKFPT